MDDTAVHQRLVAVDRLLGRLEETPGPTADTAMDAVGALTDIYGEALARIMDRATAISGLADDLAGDELIGHLLALHQVHPRGVEQRVQEAIDSLHPYVESHGGQLSLECVDHGVARIRLSGACQTCQSSSATLKGLVEEAVLTAAPELAAVEAVDPPSPEPALIPVESVVRKSAAARR
jgi:Fe-S cluster biogenesis protein NfuA